MENTNIHTCGECIEGFIPLGIKNPTTVHCAIAKRYGKGNKGDMLVNTPACDSFKMVTPIQQKFGFGPTAKL